MIDEDRERKKKYVKNYYYKKTSLNNLMNRVEELENISLNKWI